jgi:hypothetical protein
MPRKTPPWGTLRSSKQGTLLRSVLDGAEAPLPVHRRALHGLAKELSYYYGGADHKCTRCAPSMIELPGLRDYLPVVPFWALALILALAADHDPTLRPQELPDAAPPNWRGYEGLQLLQRVGELCREGCNVSQALVRLQRLYPDLYGDPEDADAVSLERLRANYYSAKRYFKDSLL